MGTHQTLSTIRYWERGCGVCIGRGVACIGRGVWLDKGGTHWVEDEDKGGGHGIYTLEGWYYWVEDRHGIYMEDKGGALIFVPLPYP